MQMSGSPLGSSVCRQKLYSTSQPRRTTVFRFCAATMFSNINKCCSPGGCRRRHSDLLRAYSNGMPGRHLVCRSPVLRQRARIRLFRDPRSRHTVRDWFQGALTQTPSITPYSRAVTQPVVLHVESFSPRDDLIVCAAGWYMLLASIALWLREKPSVRKVIPEGPALARTLYAQMVYPISV